MAKNQTIFRTKSSRIQILSAPTTANQWDTPDLTIGADGSVIRSLTFKKLQTANLASNTSISIEIYITDGVTETLLDKKLLFGEDIVKIYSMDLLADISLEDAPNKYLQLENGQSLKFVIDDFTSDQDFNVITAIIEDY